MPEPYEVVAQPFTLWVAPTGETYPAVESAPAGNWAKVGSSGDLNYKEDGVTLTHGQTVEAWRALGSTGPRKAFRTEEEMHVQCMLADVTLEQYKHALNENAVTTVAPGANAGYKVMGLSRGLGVSQLALLVRGAGGPYGETYSMQYECPVVVEMGEQEVVFVKGEPAALALDFLVLEDPTASTVGERFGRLLAMNAEAT